MFLLTFFRTRISILVATDTYYWRCFKQGRQVRRMAHCPFLYHLGLPFQKLNARRPFAIRLEYFELEQTMLMAGVEVEVEFVEHLCL